eukprot:GHVU01062286.1.p1 GENE.GHVU01062286.1~~GHVU01062286.1.p1  ORF type:complete len:283 (+),score=33.89 GHVU01062286.1:58-906(+)
MPGTITFKPIEAKLKHDTDLIGKADPYCMFTLGTQKLKGQVCKSGGVHPVWNDSITIPATSGQQICLVEVKDKDILKDDKMGAVEVDLREIESQGKVHRWFPLYHKNKPTGELLMEAIYTPDMHSQGIPMQKPIQTGMQMGMPHHNTTTMMTGGMPMPMPVHNTIQKTQVITKETHLIGGAPLNPIVQTHIPQVMPTMIHTNYVSPAEQYAREALIRGVDPLGTHLHQQMPVNNMVYPQGQVQGIDAHNYGGQGSHHHNQQYGNQQMTFGHGNGHVQNPNKF